MKLFLCSALDLPFKMLYFWGMNTQPVITKAEAVAHFGTQSALAAALGITRSAVCQWADGPIPKEHELRLRYEIAPEVFKAA